MKKITKKLFKSRNYKSGFTLIELIIYMGVISIMLLILTNVLVAIVDTQLSTQSTAAVATDGRYIYSKLIYDIESADSISDPANLGDTSSSLTMDIGGTTYTYQLNGDTLLLSDNTGNSNLNSPETTVSDLVFTRIGNAGGNHTIKISFTVANKIPLHGKVESQPFQTTVGLQ